MSFLDKKEQVVEVVLTPYGRKLLSQGTLMPAFYAFYDSDIIYDGRYAGLTNYQNDILPRIKDETARQSPLFNIVGVDTTNSKIFSSNEEGYRLENPTRLDIANNNCFLANSEIGVQNAPALNILMLKSEISSSSGTLSSSYGEMTIPQLDIDLKGITVADVLDDEMFDLFMPIEKAGGSFNFTTIEDTGEKIIKVYDDKTVLKVARNNIVALFTEFNSREFSSNFEMEAFLVTEEKVTNKATGEDKTVITPEKLYFEEDVPNSVFHFLSIESDFDVSIPEKEPPQVTTSIYDNLPQIEEDFCED